MGVSDGNAQKKEVPVEVKQGAANRPSKIPRLEDRLTEELVIALVGPIGSGCSSTYEQIAKIFKEQYAYQVHYYKLSEHIKAEAKLIKETFNERQFTAKRVDKLQTIGDKLREELGNSYLTAKAIEEIAQKRAHSGFKATDDGIQVPIGVRQVHIIDSIKHPEELKLLRATYGEILWLIGVFAPPGIREKRLISKSQGDSDKAELSKVIKRDYLEDDEHGQKVRDVFYQADFFVRNDHENKSPLGKSLERFLEIIFGRPVHTPTIDESSMYVAYAEAAKSACLSRQVGAAVVSNKGELIGLGRNDVPVYGGGLYTEDTDGSDHRCHAWGNQYCHNDRKKAELYKQIFDKLKDNKLLAKSASSEAVIKAVKATGVNNLIEYSRSVHAEMDAITSVARTHKAGLLGGTLYSTTFPCHSCARHIVAAGIDKVFFIEPYPKSLAMELHSDSVSESEGDAGKKVLFLQFSGIAPKNILKLFNVEASRKESGGELKPFDKKKLFPVIKVSLDDYPTHEKWVIAELAENEEKLQNRQSTLFYEK